MSFLEQEKLEQSLVEHSLLEQNKTLARNFIEALNRADQEAVLGAYAEGASVWTAGSTPISGRRSVDELKPFLAGILDAFPQGIHFDIKTLTAESNRVAMEVESRAIHASGKNYQNQYHFLMYIENGKIVELREYLDTQLALDVLCEGMV